MLLQELEISSFRNISQASLCPAPGLNLIVGDNASGKTSLLEAIYYLSRARSFRSSLTRALIQDDAVQFALFARMITDRGDRHIRLGIERTLKQMQIRCQGSSVASSSVLTRNFPVLFLGSDSFQLLTGGPRQRRRLMDWCLFHVEQDYLDTLGKYQHVLSQRNAILRQASLDPVQLRPWDSQLGPLGMRLHHYREAFIPHFAELLSWRWSLMDGQKLSVDYAPGWDVDLDYGEELARRATDDIRRSYTRFGPHTADIRFRIDDRPLTQSLSRGQMKRFITCVILTQADLYRQHHDDSPCLLIDDLPAELDGSSRRELLKTVHESGLQVFVTATHECLLGDAGLAQARFHVEHGRVDKVVL